MRWPFELWGATATFAGHDHTYERLRVGNIPYFVNGRGGKSLYPFVNIAPESQFRYNADYGAMLVTATNRFILFQFYNRQYQLIDQYLMFASPLIKHR